ncbi:MAG TPA: hypothetical protein PLU72_02095 [Candidatus Ozemobacteraceae bacterium]|nr:hypothetical protein [Candidatus Ozemobacteraceae bacterium]
MNELPRPYRWLVWRSGSELGPEEREFDAAVRRLVNRCRMPTPGLTLSYHAEPSFFQALAAQGDEHHLVYSRREVDGELMSIGIRSLRPAWIEGAPARLAYIHHLRVHPDHRGGTLLARGYQAFREVSRAFPAPLTVTSILEGNAAARDVLANPAGRGPLPGYLRLSGYLTALFPLRGPGGRWPRRGRRIRTPFACEIRPLTGDDIPALRTLAERFGRTGDGAWWSPPDGAAWGPQSLWPGLRVNDVLGAFAGNALVAAVGVWNRSETQQIRLSDLHPVLSAIRRVWEAGGALWGRCPLPAEGGEVPHRLLDPWAVEPGWERRVMPALLDAALDAARREGALFAAWGVAEGHPAKPAADRFFYFPYASSLFTVAWPETPVADVGRRRPLAIPLGML